MSRLSEEYNARLSKVEMAKTKKINPYPSLVKRSHTILELIEKFKGISSAEKIVYICGRITAIRLHGGSCFLHINDGTEKFQIFLKRDRIGEEKYKIFKDLFDPGDFIQVSGKLFITKRGEKSLLVDNYIILAKSLFPLPEKWHGLSDIEIRYRQRYLDLITNPQVRQIFIKRSIIINTLRKILNENDFIEVDTPILQSVPGGANAKPFITHHNALSIDFYLRIAPELFLKRLIIGGMEKVYEISRCFRNEGIDKDHNPEFTQVEFYAAYWDYKKLMAFTENLISAIVTKIHNAFEFEYDGNKINFTPPFKIITFQEASQKYGKLNIQSLTDEALIKEAKIRNIKFDKKANKAKILDEIFKQLIRPNLIQPTFVIDYPIELSPLAKKKENNPLFVERFQLVAGGKELANAFTELNDPIDQKQRFENQEKMRTSGDDEAQRIDYDFLDALSYGMPPTAGIGIGIDRLTNLLTNTHNIKEVILFPTLKPKSE